MKILLFSKKSSKDIENDTTYLSYFEEKTIYIIFKELIGIIKTNSDLLFIQVTIARGITQKELDDKDTALLDYPSALDRLKFFNKCYLITYIK